MNTTLKTLGLAVFALATTLSLGCATTPEDAPTGSHGGRLDDSYRSTSSDMASERASIPALLEFTDATAQQLAQEISALPHVQQRLSAENRTQERMILEMGGIDNKTRTPSSDFELIQRRLRSQLMRSQLIRSKFMFVESNARQAEELRRIQGPNAAPANQYANDDVYILQGDFNEAIRGNRRQYFFNFKLTHAQTREIVFDSSYDLGQMTVREE